MSLDNVPQKYLNLAVWSSIVWLEIFFLISTKLCDAVTKNDDIITSLSDWFTVGLSSWYKFLSDISWFWGHCLSCCHFVLHLLFHLHHLLLLVIQIYQEKAYFHFIGLIDWYYWHVCYFSLFERKVFSGFSIYILVNILVMGV